MSKREPTPAEKGRKTKADKAERAAKRARMAQELPPLLPAPSREPVREPCDVGPPVAHVERKGRSKGTRAARKAARVAR